MATRDVRRLDLTLAAELRLIRGAPAWPSVPRSLERQRDPAAGSPAERQVEVKLVHNYAEMLRQHAATIATAVTCAAAVGRLARTDRRGEQVMTGLRVIADACRFTALDDAGVAAALGRLREELRGAYGLLPVEEPKLSALTEARTVTRWTAAVKKTLKHVQAASLDENRLHGDAAASLRERLAAYIGSGASLEPHVAELMVAAAGESTAGLVAFDLASMSLSRWSRLAFSGLVSFPGFFWHGLAALHALGIHAGSWSELVDWLTAQGISRPPPQGPFIAGQLPPPRHESVASAPLVLVIRRERDSVTERWPVSRDTPALALTVDEAMTVLRRLKRLGGPPPLRPPLGTVAFEMPMEAKGADDKLLTMFRRKLPSELTAAARVAYLYPEPPTGSAREPRIVAPRGVQDLIAESPPPPA
jgi:hypothetical protein